MEPTEHELTLAVDAIAKWQWDLERQMRAVAGGDDPIINPPLPEWSQLPPLHALQLRERVLPAVRVVLDALPDRRADAWDEGHEAGVHAESVAHDHNYYNGHPDGAGNPYKAADQ